MQGSRSIALYRVHGSCVIAQVTDCFKCVSALASLLDRRRFGIRSNYDLELSLRRSAGYATRATSKFSRHRRAPRERARASHGGHAYLNRAMCSEKKKTSPRITPLSPGAHGLEAFKHDRVVARASLESRVRHRATLRWVFTELSFSDAATTNPELIQSEAL